jgi:transposase
MRQQANRERRLACYVAVMEKIRQGVTQVDIARRCGVAIRTIRRWIRARRFPERKTTARTTKVDRHSEYLRGRWLARPSQN